MNEENLYIKQFEADTKKKDDFRSIIEEAGNRGNLNLISQRESDALRSHLIGSSKSFLEFGKQHGTHR